MERMDLADAPAVLTDLSRRVAAEQEPLAITDGEAPVAWVVPHHEYAQLLALAHRARQDRAGEAGPRKRSRLAEEFEARKAADASLQQAWADRQAVWTIKG
jgi:PHD/YefM family antitoxin component YafN of YafNO toxin-antitoxin module